MKEDEREAKLQDLFDEVCRLATEALIIHREVVSHIDDAASAEAVKKSLKAAVKNLFEAASKTNEEIKKENE